MPKVLTRRKFLSFLGWFFAQVCLFWSSSCKLLRLKKLEEGLKEILPTKMKDISEIPKEPPQISSPPLERVAIVQGEDPSLNVSSAIDLIGGLDSLVKPGQTVVVKPNLTSPARSGSGVVTDVRVTEAVIKCLREAGAKKIIIAEGPGGKRGIAMRAFGKAGYIQMAKELGVELVDLNSAPVREVNLSNGLAYKKYFLPSVVLDAGMFVNIAVLKTHNLTTVTLSLKNLIGVPPTRIYGAPRNVFHNHINEVIIDLNTIIKSHLVIIDGTAGMEGWGPISGEPVKMNLIIAGLNTVAVDSVAAQVMGVFPSEVGHIKLAAQRRLGEINIDKIEVRGRQIDEVARKFRLP